MNGNLIFNREYVREPVVYCKKKVGMSPAHLLFPVRFTFCNNR
jgi:hypothetical protein